VGELKADPRTARIPVIALTAHSMAGDRERALAAGSDDDDTKPVEFIGLLEKIEELLVRLSADPPYDSDGPSPRSVSEPDRDRP
jgi:CheY-like chemotaxis protein